MDYAILSPRNDVFGQKKVTMLSSREFKQGGIYVLRDNNAYMIVDCGRNGLNDWGGHAHNDILGFELAIGSTTFLIDPGSYTYTYSYQWHKEFRSTAFHNTVMVDEKEINRFDLYDLWKLENDAIPSINCWETGSTFDLLDAQHTGYMRLKSPILHRRQILFKKQSPYWIIRDVLDGQDQHIFDLFFHTGDADARFLTPLIVELQSRMSQDRFLIVPLVTNNLTASLESTWCSYGYGHKVENCAIKYRKVVSAPTEFITVLWPSSSCDSVKQVGSVINQMVESDLQMLIELQKQS